MALNPISWKTFEVQIMANAVEYNAIPITWQKSGSLDIYVRPTISLRLCTLCVSDQPVHLHYVCIRSAYAFALCLYQISLRLCTMCVSDQSVPLNYVCIRSAFAFAICVYEISLCLCTICVSDQPVPFHCVYQISLRLCSLCLYQISLRLCTICALDQPAPLHYVCIRSACVFALCVYQISLRLCTMCFEHIWSLGAACTPSEDADQHMHVHRMIRDFTVCMKTLWILAVPRLRYVQKTLTTFSRRYSSRAIAFLLK